MPAAADDMRNWRREEKRGLDRGTSIVERFIGGSSGWNRE
jgi:hypothetical protein